MAEENKKPFDQKKQDNKKWQSITKYQKKIRHTKNFVISVMGEFAKACQSKQVPQLRLECIHAQIVS